MLDMRRREEAEGERSTMGSRRRPPVEAGFPPRTDTKAGLVVVEGGGAVGWAPPGWGRLRPIKSSACLRMVVKSCVRVTVSGFAALVFERGGKLFANLRLACHLAIHCCDLQFLARLCKFQPVEHRLHSNLLLPPLPHRCSLLLRKRYQLRQLLAPRPPSLQAAGCSHYPPARLVAIGEAQNVRQKAS